MSFSIRRIIYASEATGDPAIDLSGILVSSRANNGIDGVTGMLWVAGARYLQVLEGPDASVTGAFVRIARDPRHRDVEMLLDEMADERAFGDWHMAAMPGERPEDSRDRLHGLLAGCAPDLVGLFADAA